jgi:hypothetical protein
LKFFLIIFKQLREEGDFFGFGYCCGGKKGDICTPNRRERCRGVWEERFGCEVLKEWEFGFCSGGDKKKYFHLLLKSRKLRLPLHSCSEGTGKKRE